MMAALLAGGVCAILRADDPHLHAPLASSGNCHSLA